MASCAGLNTRRSARGAGRLWRGPRGGAGLRRRLRHAAVRGAARAGAPGIHFYHPQPLARHARDPQRAAAGQSLVAGGARCLGCVTEEIPYTVRRSARARRVRVNAHAHSGAKSDPDPRAGARGGGGRARGAPVDRAPAVRRPGGDRPDRGRAGALPVWAPRWSWSPSPPHACAPSRRAPARPAGDAVSPGARALLSPCRTRGRSPRAWTARPRSRASRYDGLSIRGQRTRWALALGPAGT